MPQGHTRAPEQGKMKVREESKRSARVAAARCEAPCHKGTRACLCRESRGGGGGEKVSRGRLNSGWDALPHGPGTRVRACAGRDEMRERSKGTVSSQHLGTLPGPYDKPASAHGPHGPAWHMRSHVCLPQSSGRPHTRAHWKTRWWQGRERCSRPHWQGKELTWEGGGWERSVSNETDGIKRTAQAHITRFPLLLLVGGAFQATHAVLLCPRSNAVLHTCAPTCVHGAQSPG